MGGGTAIGTVETSTAAGAVRSLVSFDANNKQTTVLTGDLYQTPGTNEFCPWALVR